jgi:DNA-nicking Smr family endonuclease
MNAGTPPQSPPKSRRHRPLSDDEHALWQNVAKSTTPLKRGPRAAKAAKPEGAAPPDADHPVLPAAKPAREHHVGKAATRASTAPPSLAPLSRREKSRLSRGRDQIDARIDLHGMTQARAHRALLSFLRHAHGDGAAFVLVITGKGRTVGVEREPGVLRRQVPHWLALPEFRAFVVGFDEAHIGHGGEGALYVRVRRAR